jgi:hypothetical protein
MSNDLKKTYKLVGWPSSALLAMATVCFDQSVCFQSKGSRGAVADYSAADQVYGDENMQDEVRRLCMQYMEQERDYFSQFVTEGFSDYIARKRQDGTFGNHLELQAISEMFSRPIEIFAYNEGKHACL